MLFVDEKEVFRRLTLLQPGDKIRIIQNEQDELVSVCSWPVSRVIDGTQDVEFEGKVVDTGEIVGYYFIEDLLGVSNVSVEF